MGALAWQVVRTRDEMTVAVPNILAIVRVLGLLSAASSFVPMERLMMPFPKDCSLSCGTTTRMRALPGDASGADGKEEEDFDRSNRDGGETLEDPRLDSAIDS